jgi:peptidoglycan/LPS O-acetylase OafA/YrhL
MADDRITALDGLRAVAVFGVIGFHYFARWTPPLNPVNFYPYDAVLSNLWPIRYGYLGVHLFFLVSGFVISLTLTRCRSWQEFALRRFARLGPPMLLASFITFLVVSWVPPHLFAVRAVDFLPSLSFTHPAVIKAMVGVDSRYIDGAYWSLFVEVRFYFWACLLYFWNTQAGFLRRSAWLMQATVATLVTKCVWPGRAWLLPFDVALFGEFCPWLIAGVAFYFIWRREQLTLAWMLIAQSVVVNIGYHAYSEDWSAAAGVAVLYGIFCTFVLRPTAFRVLNAGWLTAVGAASYSLYLLHQRIGVTLIMAISGTVGIVGSPWSICAAVLVAALLTFVAIVCYRYYEVPSRRLVARLGASWIAAPNQASI